MDESQYKEMNDRINAGIEIKQLLESRGWSRVQALLDKMIIDTIGGKSGDRWCTNAHKFDKPMELTDRELMFLMGYRQGLSEFNNTVHGIVLAAERAQNAIKDMEERSKLGQAYNYGESYGDHA